MSSQEADAVHDPAQSLASLTANLLRPGRYSDLNIKYRGKVFKAHRNAVAFQSKPLAAEIDGNFKVSSGSLAAVVPYCFHSRMIANIFPGSKDQSDDLEDHDPNIIEKFIDFLYTEQYDDGGSKAAKTSAPEASNALHTNTALYIVGDKFDVTALKTLAKEEYEKTLSASWNCILFTSNLKLVYAGTAKNDRLLMGVATNAAANHVEELVKNSEFAELCQCDGDIGFAVLKSCHSPTLQALVKKCESCQQYFGKKLHHQPYYTCSSCGYTY
jgi:hypothetical protein